MGEVTEMDKLGLDKSNFGGKEHITEAMRMVALSGLPQVTHGTEQEVSQSHSCCSATSWCRAARVIR
jgi:hypothetical protein